MEQLQIWEKSLETKKQIRREILKKRETLSEQEWQKRSERLTAFLLEQPIYKESKIIYCYVSYRFEADTWRFIMYSLKSGKRVAVPKVCGNEMKFYYIRNMDELKEGYRGIFEPPETNEEATEEGALFIMPLIAFDRKNHRLGYGGGFYDRYLEKHPNHYKIGIGFSFQEKEYIPVEQYDINPDKIWTDEGEIQ